MSHKNEKTQDNKELEFANEKLLRNEKILVQAF